MNTSSRPLKKMLSDVMDLEILKRHSMSPIALSKASIHLFGLYHRPVDQLVLVHVQEASRCEASKTELQCDSDGIKDAWKLRSSIH